MYGKFVDSSGASPGFGRGGGKNFFFRFGNLHVAKRHAAHGEAMRFARGVRGHAPPDFFLNGAIWCVYYTLTNFGGGGKAPLPPPPQYANVVVSTNSTNVQRIAVMIRNVTATFNNLQSRDCNFRSMTVNF